MKLTLRTLLLGALLTQGEGQPLIIYIVALCLPLQQPVNIPASLIKLFVRRSLPRQPPHGPTHRRSRAHAQTRRYFPLVQPRMFA